MALNLEIWSAVIGLMELGCALTWNHDEQFVESDFPYYPYTNRIYAHADTGGALTDARIRSDEFSGYKTALNRRNYHEKRKPLYAFNKDSNKVIDATKLNLDERENGSVNEKLPSRQDIPRNLEAEETEKTNSAGFKLESAESEASVPPERKKPNNPDSGGSTRVDPNQHFLKFDEPGKLKQPLPHVSPGFSHLGSNGTESLGSALEARKYAKSQEQPTARHKVPDPRAARLSGGSKKKKPNDYGVKSNKFERLVPEKGKTKSSAKARHSGSNRPRLTSASPRGKDPKGNEKADSAGSEIPNHSGLQNAKSEHKFFAKNHRKSAQVRREKSKALSLTMLENKRHRRNSGLEANLVAWKSRKIGESNSEDLWAHGIHRNTTQVESSKRKATRESKPSEKSRKLTLVAPYETNYTGGGFRSVNPTSWLAKEIEKFIRRKDHRWLDFMRNTGMGVKKHSSVVSQAKRKSDHSHSGSQLNRLDVEKVKTDQLIDRIDSLLADLNQFKSSVKNGWLDAKRTRETDPKIMNDVAIDGRKQRKRRGIRFGRTRPPNELVSVENDLRDLKRNVVLYQNQLPDEEKQALRDMKLHIKVYVEKEKQRRHRTRGSEAECYYQTYPREIHYEQ